MKKTGRVLLLIIASFFFYACSRPSPEDKKGTAEVTAIERTAEREKSAGKQDLYFSQRLDMVSLQLEARGMTDKKVLDAMRITPRHLFVPSGYRDDSYGDYPLPIGYGQTISQPYIVALMTALLELDSSSRVLEVGTGSGYQAAVLSHIAKEVYSVEIVKELYERSRRDLAGAGYGGIRTLCADGYYGWKDHAPYDAIIVTCASEFIPPPLLEQLKNGGRMCIPVGPPFKVQHLLLVRKSQKGEVSVEMITEVRFVPLVRSTE